MDPLPYLLRECLTWSLVCPRKEPMTKRQKAISVLLCLTLTLILACGSSSCLDAVLKLKSNKLERSLNVLFEVSALFTSAYVNIITFYQRKIINAMLEHLSEIYNTRKFTIVSFNTYSIL